MSGGKSAQLGFYYQNLFCVHVVLEELTNKLVSAKVECPLKELGIKGKEKGKEVDLVLEFQESHKYYYEIKSGITFTEDDEQIKDAILTLFTIYTQNRTQNGKNQDKFFLIINPDYRSAIAERIMQLKKIQERKRESAVTVKTLCKDLQIQDQDTFQQFCLRVTIETGKRLNDLRKLCFGTITEYVKDKVFNTNYALSEEDLLNNLIILILRFLENDNGTIDLPGFLQAFVKWCAVNETVYKASVGTDSKKILQEQTDEFSQKFQSQFPHIPLIRTKDTLVTSITQEK